MSKLVSIIVPVYNAEKYLAECISSVLEQTYIDIELILIDDCSQDGSAKICKEYMRQDKRVIFIKNERNLGGGETRNKGLDICRGVYIGFLDADDYLDRDYVGFLVRNIEESNADIAYAGWYSKEIKRGKRNKIFIEERENIIKHFLCFKKIGGYVWGKIYRSDVIGDIRFARFRIGEDGDFTMRVLLNCNSVIYTDIEKYFYRIRTNSATERSLFSDKSFDGIERLDYLKEYLLTHGMTPNFVEKYFPVFMFHVCYPRYRKMQLFNVTEQYREWYERIVNILNGVYVKAFCNSINLRTKRDVLLYISGLDKYIK